MADRKFYDIHFHTMNLAHPNILAFIRQTNWQLLLLASPLATIAAALGGRTIKNVQNLLSVMENDIGSLLMLVEYYLKQNGLVSDDCLIIGGERFDSIVVTPLMMDFGYKNILTDTFYRIPPQKPIVSQVTDVFKGIRDYCANELIEKQENGRTTYDTAPRNERAIFEVYPFLGINTRNYDLAHVEKMLDKYFSDYHGNYNEFRANRGRFKGDIDEMRSNYFAGIKLYPPIGFDPWPAGDKEELAKVEALYTYCCSKDIPVTVHCSDGGFALDKKARELTSPARWAEVLAQERFHSLKLNFAHFGKQSRKKYLLFSRDEWRERIIGLIREYPNIYTDLSYVGTADENYMMLEEIYKRNPHIAGRLLFGSDFMINLMDMESYNSYLEIFSGTGSFSVRQKMDLCNINPEQFLWRQ
jgi:hypothetical protein